MQDTVRKYSQEPSCTDSEASAEHDVEKLAKELKRLLFRHKALLDEEGVNREVKLLEQWMDSYRCGLVTAHILSETSATWLTNLHDRLKLTAEEMQTLEGEGGIPANKEQAEKIEQLFRAIDGIEKILEI